MIKLHNISKTFKTASSSQQILKNVDFSVMPEDFITIAGPSGCGKSTLLSIISLLLPPDDGKITYNGVNVDFSSQAQLEQMRVKYTGLIFQNPNLISSLNVLENVLAAAKRSTCARDMVKRFGGAYNSAVKHGWKDLLEYKKEE